MTTPTVSTRRSFIQATGAALSVPLAAAAAGPAAGPAGTGDPLAARLAHIEDLQAIRALNQAYARLVSSGPAEAVAALFADPARVQIDPDVRGLTPDGFGEQDLIDIASDRQTATSTLPCAVHLETAIGPDCPLVEMARQQGGGVVRRTERGVLEHAYVRHDGVWKIQRAAYRLV